MALDKNDIELLRSLIHDEVHSAVQEEVQEVHSSIREEIHSAVQESETRIMAYIESHVEKKIDALADGLLATNERIDRLTDRVDEMNETVLANTFYIIADARGKKQPPKAQ